MFRHRTMIAVAAALFAAVSVSGWPLSFLSAAEPTSTDPAPASALTGTERQAIESEVLALEQRLADLRDSPGVTADLWADANIFLKAVTWALDFGPIETEQDRKLVQRGVQRARERIDALVAGRPTWETRKGRVARGFISEVDGSTQPYGLIIPAGYDPEKPMRLDVVLHGSTRPNGIRELQFLMVRDRGDGDEPSPPDAEFIEVHPMGRLGENAYRFEGETDVDEAIAAVCRNYRIDRSRIVMRGSSLGGVGTWQLGLKRPDRYVALGPAAGPVDTHVFAAAPWKHFVRLEPLTPWQERLLHLVDGIDYTANAGMVPVVAVMGDQDPYFSSHQLIQEAFEKEDVPFHGFVDEGAGHRVSDEARQKQLEMLGEFASPGRDPSPTHIRFVTWTLKFSRCYWIEILGLSEHYQRAEIEAQRADDGSVSVTTLDNITRFAVQMTGTGEGGKNFPLSVEGQDIAVPERPGMDSRMLVLERKDGEWFSAGDLDQIELSGKRPGLQGPIDDAFARPFLCVRGTGDAWNAAVGAWADASLNRFADEWRRHYRGYLPVKNDTEVTAEDVRRCNLILFGDPGSNSWIEKILPMLPVNWDREEIHFRGKSYSAADHGIQMISPNPLPGAEGRYVVLNSGHTYHDAELRFSYMVFPRLGDWAIVKVGESDAGETTVMETVLDSGFFNEAWE